MRTALAGLGLLAHHARLGGPAAVADRQVAGQRHLDAAAADLDDHLLPRLGLFLVDLAAAGERFDGVVPLGLDPAGVHREAVVVADERRVAHHGAVERDDGGQALDVELVQGAPGTLDGLRPVGAGDDQLGQHRVELPADHRAGLHAGVQPDTGTGRRLEPVDRAGRGQEAAAGVLAVDAEFDGVPAWRGILGDVQLLAVGDAELLADQVDAGGLLGDRVLHLQAGVHLEERDQAVLADQILDGAGAVVVGLLADPLGRLVDLLALRVGEERRRRLLDQLLEAALQRAVAGARDDDVAVLVGDHLGLDVARLVQVALDEALAAAERRDGLAGGRLEQLGDLLDAARHLHAAPAAAEGGLDGDRHAVLLGERHHLVGVLDRVRGAGHQRRLGAGGDVAGGDLVAEVADGLRARADPDQPGVDDGLGEVGVLGEEAVPGVHGVGAGLGRGVQQLAEVQIRLR